MPTPDDKLVKNVDIEEITSDEIDLLNILHELANTLDGTRRYTKLLTNELPESNPLRVYAESIQANLDRISHMQKAVMDFIKRDLFPPPKA